MTDCATHEIHYLNGNQLLTHDDRWYAQIEATTEAEAHLLKKTRVDLEPAVQDNRVIVAFSDIEVVGCIVLWDLAPDETGEMWYELGTFLVVPTMRFNLSGLPIGDVLYRMLLEQHRGKNILGTTTNHKAIKTGRRHGMQMIAFSQLPEAVRAASCICPVNKTGVNDNRYCRIKDGLCRVRVSFNTWVRMGRPVRIPYAA
jgi:hypothetical protein